MKLVIVIVLLIVLLIVIVLIQKLISSKNSFIACSSKTCNDHKLSIEISSGEKDVNTLTDNVYYRRHPNSGKIKNSRSAEAKEWILIRDTIVKPALECCYDTERIIVGMGDSLMSGDGSRWAGNATDDSSKTDVSSQSYFEQGVSTGRCLRGKNAEIHIGNVKSFNLACAGAKTFSEIEPNFTSGIDFYHKNSDKGQALLLQELASKHTGKIDAIYLSIGINNLGFGKILLDCSLEYIKGKSCKKSTASSDRNLRSIGDSIFSACMNIMTAMKNADYEPGTFTLVIQTYPSIMPNSGNMRYEEKAMLVGNERMLIRARRGCPVMDSDIDQVNNTLLKKFNEIIVKTAERLANVNPKFKIKVLRLDNALNGRRLCESGVGTIEEKNLESWRESGAVNKLEWATQIRFLGDYDKRESSHPNYWGSLAIRNCVRQSYNNGNVIGGDCVRKDNGLINGEPKMKI